MSSNTAALPAPLTRDETGTLFGQTMGLVAVTAGLFALGAYLGRNMSYGWGWVFWIAGFASLIAMNAVAQRSERGAVTLLFGFGVLIGLASAPTLSYYASTNPQALWQAGGATALVIGGFGAAGYATRRDLSGVARALFWALIALIVFGIVAIFVRIPHRSLIYAVVGLVIFAGLTVAVSVTGLAFFGLDFVTKLGIGSALGVLTTVLIANSLLLAVLALLGHKIDRLKVPFLRPLDDSEEGREKTLVARWGRFVTAHAKVVFPVVLALILVLAATSALVNRFRSSTVARTRCA